ncbi:ribose transport system permease protein [Kibdelosporangium banguiense]|uniref:Ribose transport system permease protein n=1 Tax=Kibdelosporangium banguiense TaxID=1365924 RepID=A0ABS4TGG1_9PSEU|nr:ABC transporter permease [Kibdelosporangium banguiense]MBP2323464.1 ribose transport system permease protein [Kibdelosporangium banguiense]
MSRLRQAGQHTIDATSVPRPATTRLRRLAARPTSMIFLVLVLVIVLFSVLSPAEFATTDNARNIALDAAVLLVLAVGSTFVIITAGIDLSVGSVLVFSGVVSAKAMGAMGGDGWGTALVGLVVAVVSGAAWGAFNGVLVARAKIPSFVVTLGTLGAALGLAYIMTDGLDVRTVPDALVEVGVGRLAGVPWLVLIAVAVAIVFGVLLAQTRFGRHTYAIGANAQAAERATINVKSHLITVYVLAGALAGLAGYLALARFGTTTIAGHATDNLQVITAVVIGGTSLFGGIGTILGTCIGVLIPAVLQNGFVIMGLVPYWQQVAVGAVLIIAVLVDQLRRARASG